MKTKRRSIRFRTVLEVTMKKEVRNEMRHGFILATVEQHPELMGRYGVTLSEMAPKREEVPDYYPTPLDLIAHNSN